METEVAEDVEYMVNGKPLLKEEYDQSKLETNAMKVLRASINWND